jgi:hypothetical protein
MLRTTTHTKSATRFERGRDWCVGGYQTQAINPPVEALDQY